MFNRNCTLECYKIMPVGKSYAVTASSNAIPYSWMGCKGYRRGKHILLWKPSRLGSTRNYAAWSHKLLILKSKAWETRKQKAWRRLTFPLLSISFQPSSFYEKKPFSLKALKVLKAGLHQPNGIQPSSLFQS